MTDENTSSGNMDYKEISDRLRRRLNYREQQLTALRKSLGEDSSVHQQLNESFISNSAISDNYPRVVEEIRRSAADSNFQEISELRLKLKETSEQLSFQTRRANLLHERLSDLEHRGIVASSHSRASEEEISRLRLRISDLESERQSLLSQTAGLEQTRQILRKQIEKISDLKNKARTSGTQTDSGLRLSRDELELRVLRSEIDNKNSEISRCELEISRLRTEIQTLSSKTNTEILSLQRDLLLAREHAEQKISAAKREAVKVHTELTTAHQEELERIRIGNDNDRKSLVQDYERKLEEAIKLREDAIKNSAENSLAEKCKSLEISLAEISDLHKQELEKVHAEREMYESEIRAEMEKIEFDMNKERGNFQMQIGNLDREISNLNDKLTEMFGVNNQLDDELKRTIGNFKNLEIEKAAAIEQLEIFCREKDERINSLTLELERVKEISDLNDRKFQRKLELWQVEHNDVVKLESEKSKEEISRLLGLLETERKTAAEQSSASAQEISDLKRKFSALQSEISRKDLALQSEESKAQYAMEVRDMEISTLKISAQRLEERVADLKAQLDRERRETAETAELDRKYLQEVERKYELASSKISDLQTPVSTRDAEIVSLESEISRLRDFEASRASKLKQEISDLQISARQDQEHLRERLEVQEAEICRLRSEREIMSGDLNKKTSEIAGMVEKLRLLEDMHSKIFQRNVELVEVGSTSEENFTQLSRQLKLETVALIDYLASDRPNASEVQELQMEIRRLQESRETLSASAKELCDKVGTLTNKYRRTQQELQIAKEETKVWHERYLKQLRNN